MSWLDVFRRRFGAFLPAPQEVSVGTLPATKISMSISSSTAARFAALQESLRLGMPVAPRFMMKRYDPLPGVLPTGMKLAADSAHIAYDAVFTQMFGDAIISMGAAGAGFPGYPFLTELTQITEYRDLSERVATEMTRKWIKLRGTSDEDKSERIKAISEELKRLHVRDLFKDAAIRDGWFGRCQIFIDMGANSGDELKSPLMLNKFKVGKDSIRGLKLVEPISTYPAAYNAANPLAQDYYRPSSWFVYGQEVHTSRLLTFVGRPVPDLLKPVFNFGGISLSQLGMPYVDYWLSTRTNVGEILKNFRTTVLKTDMSDALADQGSGENTIQRLQIFAGTRDNFGVFAIDASKGEEVREMVTSLAGLKDLQAAAQEHMAAVAKTPLVVLLGISPTGLNASSEGEMRAFNDHIHAQQESLFRTNLEVLLKVVMLSLFGEIDSEITFDFEPLVEMTEKERAMIRKSDAEAGSTYILEGVLDPMEERNRLANDPNSGYDNLDVTKDITPPTAEMQETLKNKGAASASSEVGAEEGSEIAEKDRLVKDIAILMSEV